MARFGRGFPPSTQTSEALMPAADLGSLNLTLPIDISSLAGNVGVGATFALTLPILVMNINAGAATPITGTFVLTIPVQSVVGTEFQGFQQTLGTFAATLPMLSVVGTEFQGSINDIENFDGLTLPIQTVIFNGVNNTPSTFADNLPIIDCALFGLVSSPITGTFVLTLPMAVITPFNAVIQTLPIPSGKGSTNVGLLTQITLFN